MKVTVHKAEYPDYKRTVCGLYHSYMERDWRFVDYKRCLKRRGEKP